MIRTLRISCLNEMFRFQMEFEMQIIHCANMLTLDVSFSKINAIKLEAGQNMAAVIISVFHLQPRVADITVTSRENSKICDRCAFSYVCVCMVFIIGFSLELE